MLFITGDTHGDLTKFKSSAMHKLKRDDYIIVCGDFGFVWDGSSKEINNLKWLAKRKYKILFVEGAHENFEMLNKYPKINFMGGKARQIADNIYQLIRGEIFEIDSKKIFAFGGGDDEDLDLMDLRECHDFTRLPEEGECVRARKNLEENKYNVDYIVTYDVGFKLRNMLEMESNCFNNLHAFLNEVAEKCSFKKWYFGCFHFDKRIPPEYYGVYKNIYNAETGKEI